MTREELMQWVDQQADTMVNVWRQIVAMESPSKDKAAVDQLGENLDSYFQGMGMTTKKFPFPEAGMALAAWTKTPAADVSSADQTEAPAAGKALKPIILMGHYDTVHPKGAFGEDTFRIDADGNVHGPGVYDMKGGIATAMLVVRALQQYGYDRRQLRLLFIGDEEVAHEYSKLESTKVFLQEAKGAAAAFNMESGALNGDVVTARKGATVISLTVHGVSAHAGREPEKGASAIREMARKILRIEALTDFKGTTYNCGEIHGGIGSNTVPDSCSVLIGIRFWTNDAYDEVMKNIREITEDNEDPRVTAEFTEVATFNAMEKTEKTDDLFERYANAAETLGCRRPSQMQTGGCSDAAYTTMLGIPTLCGTGVRGEFNHTTREYAVVSSLAEQAKKILLTILDLPDDF